MRHQKIQSSRRVKLAGAGLALVGSVYVLLPLLSFLFFGQENSWTPRSFVSTAYVLKSNDWLTFSIPSEQPVIKVITNAGVSQSDSKIANLTPSYALQYRLLDISGKIIREQSYTLRTEASTYRNPKSGAPLPINYYLGLPLVPLDSRLTMIPLEGLPARPARLDLKLVAADPVLKDVIARVYYNEKPPPYKLRYLWQRMLREKKEHLARGNIYTIDLLTASEKQNLLENRWVALAPQGISSWEYKERDLYTVDSAEITKVKGAIVPYGLCVSSDFLGVIPLPADAGCVRLEFHRLDAPLGYDSSQRVFLSWHGQALEEARHWSIPLEGEVTVYSEDFPDIRGGVLEVYAMEALVVRAFVAGLPTEMEISPEPPAVPCYLAKRDSPVEFFVSNYEVSFTAIRVDLRRAIAKDSPSNLPLVGANGESGSVTLRYELLDKDSKVVDTGMLRHEQSITLYDSLLGFWSQYRVTDPSRFYFWIPPGRTKVRFISEEGEAFITAYTAVNGLPRRVKVPEDYLSYEKNQEEFGNWFLIMPLNYGDCLRSDREAFVKVQDRPPMVSWDTLAGNYHSVVNRPTNPSMAYETLTPLEAWESMGPSFSSVYFSELPVERTIDVLFGGEPGQLAVKPKLLSFHQSLSPSDLRVFIDQILYLQQAVANPSNEIIAPDVAVGWHRLRIEAPEGLKVLINSLLEPTGSWYMERTIYSLGEKGLTYLVRKETTDRETLAMRLYLPAETRGRTQVRGVIQEFERKEGAPSSSWTFTNNVYDLQQPEESRVPLLHTNGLTLAGGELFFLSLGADLKPGSYEVSFFVEQGPPCFLYLSQIVPGRSELRQIFIEDDLQGGELVDG